MAGNLRALADVDRVIHEPARTMIVAILYNLESADFLYLQRETGLTKGNLSAHLTKLENAGYLQIEKTFRGKIPLTLCALTESGRIAFDGYRQKLRAFVDNDVHPE
jgi:DNA-binding MarR family transcriptional regulator